MKNGRRQFIGRTPCVCIYEGNIFGIFRLRRRIRSDSAQDDMGLIASPGAPGFNDFHNPRYGELVSTWRVRL